MTPEDRQEILEALTRLSERLDRIAGRIDHLQPQEAPFSEDPAVVGIGSRPAYRPDFRSVTSGQVRAAREKLKMDHAAFAGYLGGVLGWAIKPGVVARWEDGAMPPGDVLLAVAATGAPASRRGGRQRIGLAQ